MEGKYFLFLFSTWSGMDRKDDERSVEREVLMSSFMWSGKVTMDGYRLVL